MSIEKDKGNVVEFNKRIPAIEIKQHPQEVLELDEETIAVGKAKLAGMDFVEIYGDEDRSSPELMIRNQVMKIRELFRSTSELRNAFSSEQKTRDAYKDMMIDGIDLGFIKDYCAKSQIDFRNDVHALELIGFCVEKTGEAGV